MSKGPAWARRAYGSRGAISESDAAFTLVELMVVLLILAILLAVAIPLFLGVIGGATDRAAQSNGTNSLKEALTVYDGSGNQSWSSESSSQAGFAAAAPEYTWNNDTAGSGTNLVHAGSNTVSYWVGDAAAAGDGQALVLATYSKSTQTCWYIANLQATPVGSSIGSQAFVSTSGANSPGTFYAQQANATDCQASVAIDPFKWGPNWANAPVNGATTTTTTTTPTTTTTTTTPPQCPTSAVTLNGHTSTGSFTYLPASTPVPGGTWLLVRASTGPSWTYFTYGTFPAGVISYGNATCYATST